MAVNKVIYGGNTLVDLTGDTVTAADLADGVKATGADGNPIVGIMQKVTIDAELSTTSTNPVQNKVIKEALDGKLGKNDTAVNASKVNNLTVETAVPKNAKFTDTVYMHPSTHPASMITGLASVATSGNYNDLANKLVDATKSSAGLMSAADKSKLDSISSDGAYIVAALLKQNGYVKFSNGLILQWGTIYNAKAGANDNNNNNNAVTFPMPFTTVFALSPTFIIEANHGNRDVIVNLYSLSNTGAVIRCWDNSNATNDGQLTYIALGK